MKEPESKNPIVEEINKLSEDWYREIYIRRKKLRLINSYETDDELTDLIKSIKDKETILI